MDFTNIMGIVGPVLGGGGIVYAIVQGIMNKHVTRAQALQIESQANTGNADYADKIIKQADERVAQALVDKERAIKERDDAYLSAKEQRRSKQEYREKCNMLTSEKHALELQLQDARNDTERERWHRCLVNGCDKRTPPRERDEHEPMNKEINK